MKHRIYADFHNMDDGNRIRLDCAGTLDDLKRLQIELTDGASLILYTDDGDDTGLPDDLLIDGVVRRINDEWVAVVDWTSLRHVSDECNRAARNGSAAPLVRVEPIA